MLVNITEYFIESGREWQVGQNPDVPREVAARWIADGKATIDTDGVRDSQSPVSEAGGALALPAATFQASEAIAAGDAINIWDSGGAFRMRKADASGGRAKMAHGFVKEAVASGATGTAYFEGNNDQLSGLAPGEVYLSATVPGGVTQDPSSITTAGHIVQPLGYATSATAYNFEAGRPVTLA